MKTMIHALILLLTAAVAHAHTELASSSPADEATLDAAPAEIALKFSEPVRLTSLSIEGEASGKQDLGPIPSSASDAFSIEAPSLPNGTYVVSWRALSTDTHVMTGKLSFTVNGVQSTSNSGHR